MASTSSVSKSLLPVIETSPNSHPYPPPLAKYEDLVANPELFMATLRSLHASLNTKFMIPIIGGKDLDLHRLFVEVTVRGGVDKIIRERRWKDVTAVFDFPATATNASFVLRKYYVSLLYHFEQIYFFKAREYTPEVAASLQSSHALHQLSDKHEPRILQSPFDLSSGSSSGNLVTGVIDAKFESGYLVTVSIGSESLKGVLYQLPQDEVEAVADGAVSGGQDITPVVLPVVHRRRRRKKSEIRRRDPAHPKPNRSGYNFFFAEQHARLKPLYQGKDREISKMIGELWNKLKDSERTVYKDQAMRDKERYRAEMEDYRERLRTGQLVRDAVPLQQCLPELKLDTEVEADEKTEEPENVDSPRTPSDGSSLSKCGSEDHQMAEDSDEDSTQRNINVEMPAEEPGFEAPRMVEKELEGRNDSMHDPTAAKDESKGTDKPWDLSL